MGNVGLDAEVENSQNYSMLISVLLRRLNSIDELRNENIAAKNVVKW